MKYAFDDLYLKWVFRRSVNRLQTPWLREAARRILSRKGDEQIPKKINYMFEVAKQELSARTARHLEKLDRDQDEWEKSRETEITSAAVKKKKRVIEEHHQRRHSLLTRFLNGLRPNLITNTGNLSLVDPGKLDLKEQSWKRHGDILEELAWFPGGDMGALLVLLFALVLGTLANHFTITLACGSDYLGGNENLTAWATLVFAVMLELLAVLGVGLFPSSSSPRWRLFFVKSYKRIGGILIAAGTSLLILIRIFLIDSQTYASSLPSLIIH
jgi:hypothetical protein